jgi:uncharacterized protein YndB with AHSA1/START domain
MPAVQTDRIEKKVLLRAPRARVWRALTNAQEFGQWFGVRLNGSFAPGKEIEGPVTHKGYEHIIWKVTIEKMEPERLFSWRWHPAAVEPGQDYTPEPNSTLVVFQLEEVEGGTLLTVVESGFDRLTPANQAAIYRKNDEGWTAQMEFIRKYVDSTP